MHPARTIMHRRVPMHGIGASPGPSRPAPSALSWCDARPPSWICHLPVAWQRFAGGGVHGTL